MRHCTLEATGADEVRLTLEPVIPAARARDFQKWELLDLARAAVDELAEDSSARREPRPNRQLTCG